MSITPNTPLDAPELSGVKPSANNKAKNARNVGKGTLENTETIKYSHSQQQDKTTVNKLNAQPVIDKPLSKQNFTLAKQQVNDTHKLLKELNIDKKNFLKEINSGKISKETQAKLQQYTKYLTSTKNYLEYLSGKNLDSSFAKSSILAGMGLNEQQQNAALATLDKNQQLNLIYKNHGDETNVNNKLATLQSNGFTKQQALAILSFAPKSTADITLQGSTKEILTSLGFNKEQVNNLINLVDNKQAKLPANTNLLNKAGFDNTSIAILQALSNRDKLLNQEVMIKNASEHSLLLLDDLIQGFSDSKNNKVTKKSSYGSLMALYYAAMEMLQKSYAKRRKLERDAHFQQGLAAVQEKELQAELEREAGYKEFVGSMVQASVKFTASAVQMKVASSSASGAALQAEVAKSQAISGAMNASADAAKAAFSFDAVGSRAEMKESEAKEKLHDIYYRESGEYIQNLTSNLDDIVRKMQDAERSNAETKNSINRFS